MDGTKRLRGHESSSATMIVDGVGKSDRVEGTSDHRALRKRDVSGLYGDESGAVRVDTGWWKVGSGVDEVIPLIWMVCIVQLMVSQ